MRRSLLFTATCLVACMPQVPDPDQPVAIVHGRIIDGRGGAPIDDGTVVIAEGRVVAVGPASEVEIPAGARTLDAAGKTVMPGLADLHVHLLGGWNGLTVDMLGYDRGLDALLYAGVTTTLDMGSSQPFVEQLHQEITAGRLRGPRLLFVGPVFDGPTPAWPPLSFAISSPDQLPGYVRQVRRTGAAVVKAYGGLDTSMLARLVATAAEDSMRVFADVWQRNGSLADAGTGIAAFAHAPGAPLTDDALAFMAAHGVATITTLAVFETRTRRRLGDLSFLDGPLLAASFPSPYREELIAWASRDRTPADSTREARAEAWLAMAMRNVKRMFDAGILLAAGTDAPYPGDYYGEGLHRELELLVEAGLTPLQAITLATANAARLMGAEGQWGTLVPGAAADLLIVEGDPSVRIGDTRRIGTVIQAGRELDREALRFDPSSDPGFRPAGAANAH